VSRRLPGPARSRRGEAHRRAKILVAEELLNLSKILYHMVEDRRGATAQSVSGDLPTPRALQTPRRRKLNDRLENGSPGYPANTNCDAAKLCHREINPRPFQALLNVFRLMQRRIQARADTDTSWKTLALPLMCRTILSFSYCLAIRPVGPH